MSRLELLNARGFDESWLDTSEVPNPVHVRCSQCDAVVINGIACHETGCPNATAPCKECGNPMPARFARFGATCEDCREDRSMEWDGDDDEAGERGESDLGALAASFVLLWILLVVLLPFVR